MKEKPEIKATQTVQDFLSRRSNNEDMSDVSSMKSYNSQASEVLSQSGVQESTINRIAQLTAQQQALRERNEQIIEKTEKLRQSEALIKMMASLFDFFRRREKNVVYWTDFFAILKESSIN